VVSLRALVIRDPRPDAGHEVLDVVELVGDPAQEPGHDALACVQEERADVPQGVDDPAWDALHEVDHGVEPASGAVLDGVPVLDEQAGQGPVQEEDRKSTRLNSSHVKTSYAVYCLKKKI